MERRFASRPCPLISRGPPAAVEKFQDEKYDLDAKGQLISRTST
jgi:hypothetical protein